MGSNPIGGFDREKIGKFEKPRPKNQATGFIQLEREMAKKGNRTLVKLRSTESGHMYYTSKNRRNTTQRLSLKKYDPLVRKHVLYKETK